MVIKVLPGILSRNISAMTIWPFIFVKSVELKHNKILINHEKIHIKQQLELLIIPFYILYIGEWFIRLFMQGNAYKNISFEREAYTNQKNLEYLSTRKWYAFINYTYLKYS